MEMWQNICGYPQIYTDMVFVNVTTLPLEQRAGVECKSSNELLDVINEDGCDLLPMGYVVREQKHYPVWRQLRDPELLILQGCFNITVSIDKITQFSVRPPELHSIVTFVGKYYHWFYVSKTKIKRGQLQMLLTDSVESSIWVYGLNNQVYVHTKALKINKGSFGFRELC